MARASMYRLIAQVRLLIGDPSGVDAAWTDDQLQTFLDAHRTDYYYMPLTPIPTYSNTGTYYLRWVAPNNTGWWEDSVTLQDASYNALASSSDDLQSGIWNFATHQDAVLLSGSACDVNLAAADTCDAWLAKLRSAYDFTADGATFNRSQMIDNLKTIAERLRASGANGGVRTAQMIRSDVL